jgi:hypothetical protein
LVVPTVGQHAAMSAIADIVIGGDPDGETEEYIDISALSAAPDALIETAYAGSSVSTHFTDLSAARAGAGIPLPGFAQIEEDPADDTHYYEDALIGETFAEPQTEHGIGDRPSSAYWEFTLRAISPGKTFPTEDAFLPWIDQMFAQHPTGMDLIILPNASRPNPYATPHGFVAVFDPEKPVHPLLFDRHFGLGHHGRFPCSGIRRPVCNVRIKGFQETGARCNQERSSGSQFDRGGVFVVPVPDHGHRARCLLPTVRSGGHG